MFNKARKHWKNNQMKYWLLKTLLVILTQTHTTDFIIFLIKEFDRFEIKILNGYGFKAEKYFDITVNNWEIKDAGDAFQKMKKDCLEISATENKTIT